MPEPVPTDVLIDREAGIGRIVLDRPRALNALTLPMVQAIAEVLDRWRSEPLRAVTIESATPGMFCAGGDIRSIRQNTLDGNPAASEAFFTAEYRLNETLASYPVPIVALIDGICLGGGMGISVHGPFRIVTERAILAMPETAIGFFPDVGASYFLSRLPGSVGAYLGLTGARLQAGDAVDLGLATHYIASADLASVVPALAADIRPVDAVLRALASTPEPSLLAADRPRIDAAFGSTSVAEILHRLQADSSPWAAQTQAALQRASPQSLRLTLDLLLWGRQRTLRECLDAEIAATRHVVASPDFLEGVRAALVDKDRAPAWTDPEYAGTGPEYAGTGPDGKIRWTPGPRSSNAAAHTVAGKTQ
jgi:enoyl-CoA hydratase